ncbi:MAG: CxxxxCH/CxxCH domain c-type cytochrome [Myxococcales bacterium]
MSARAKLLIVVAAATLGLTLPALAAGPICGGADPHAKHLNNGLDCAVCHPLGGLLGFSNVFTYPRGTSTAGGTVTPDSPTTCAVACHSPMGGAPHTATWIAGTLDCTSCHDTRVLPSSHLAVPAQAPRSLCETCHAVEGHTSGTAAFASHPASWMDRADPGFHAFSANRGLGACQQCHQQDLAGGATGVSCAQCHDQSLPAGVTSWKTNCTMCHGGLETTNGAPPRATWGNGADPVRVGAHTSHAAAGFDCAICHVKPADALSPGHIDGSVASVTFSGLGAAAGSPAWNRAASTCTTYCHGLTLAGGTNPSPNWTRVGQGEATCGACHGLPPPPPHPAVSADLAGCNACHPLTVDPAGALVSAAAGGKHLDGVVEASGGHAASWMDPSNGGFHALAANRGLSACTSCHGADLSGGSANVACASCHDRDLPAGIASWKVNCVMCHGGADNTTGAPPRATWGNGGDAVRIGAHTAHVTPGGIAAGFDCAVCHVKPSDALSPGHVGGPTAGVAFRGLAAAGSATPSWDRAAATCSSTYCHGGYSGTYQYQVWDYGVDGLVTKTVPYAGSNATPAWTGTATACDSCHGNPPRPTGTWHSGVHGVFNDCQECHPDATGEGGRGTAITDANAHINGAIEVTPHWRSGCFGCH